MQHDESVSSLHTTTNDYPDGNWTIPNLRNRPDNVWPIPGF